MRKIIVGLIALVILCGITTLSFAQKAEGKTAKPVETKMEVIKGKIVSIDTTKNEIVIKDSKTNTEKTIVVDARVISTLKKGEEVKIEVKAGSNIAETVKKIVKPVKKSK